MEKKEDKCYVYELHCSGNNKIYVGVSVNPEKRLISHLSKAFSTNTHLQKERSIRKYGTDSIDMKIIFQGTRLECLALEVERIGFYKTLGICLNGSLGGESSSLVTPWNKGTKGLCKPNKTTFKKGSSGNLKLTKEQEDFIIEEYLALKPLKEIAKDLPIHYRCILWVLKRRGIPLRSFSPTKQEVREFYDLKKYGYSYLAISKLYNYSDTTIARHIKNLSEDK